MIVDFHTHCFADALAPKAIAQLEANAGIRAVHDGTADGLRRHLKDSGVDLGVVLPVATKPSQVPVINEWARRTADSTLLFFGALHPDDPGSIDTAAQLKRKGFAGVKLHPDYQHFFADEPRMMPLYAALRDLDLVLVMHAGWDIGCPAPIRCTPLMLRHIIDNFPGLKLVAAHMGGHALWRDVEDVLAGRPLYLDTSYAYDALGTEDMTRLIQRHGADRVLFGTDSPWKRADEEIRNIRSLDLPAADIEQILCGNARELLKAHFAKAAN